MTIAIITDEGVRNVAPLVIAAQQAAAAAQLAALAAQGAGTYYASTAAGEAATVAGQYFWVSTGGALNLYVRTVGGSTLTSRMPVLDMSTGAQLAPSGTAAAPAYSYSSDPDTGMFRVGSDAIGFSTGGSERMRVASTGLSIGTAFSSAAIDIVRPSGTPSISLGANPGSAAVGIEMHGQLAAIPAAQARAFIAIADSAIGVAGDILIAPRTSVGCSIRFLTGGTGGVERWRIGGIGTFQPGSDNSYDIGTASIRVKTYYGVAGAINTSDGREKTDLRAFTAAELSAAKRIAASIGIYQFLASIAEKGEDGARLHCGVIAQDVWAIMADEGLVDALAEGIDADSRYAFLCWDCWEAETTEAGAVIREAGSRFGIRPDQLALFLIAAQEARIAALEAVA